MQVVFSKWILIPSLLSLATMLVASEGHAQLAVKRSAGTLQRSTSLTRQSNTLGSKARGHDAEMEAARDSTSPDPDRRKDEDDREQGDRNESLEPLESPLPSDAPPSALDPAEPNDDPHRTLGRACIYGRRDQVLYRPPGATCRGDQPGKRQEEEPRAKRAATLPSPSR